MKVAMLLKCDNGMWALDDEHLAQLTRFAHVGFMADFKELIDTKKKPSEMMIEFNELLRFLRNPYKED